MTCTRCKSSSDTLKPTCSKCKESFPLCKNCVGFWKTAKCPKCDTNFANWTGL